MSFFFIAFLFLIIGLQIFFCMYFEKKYLSSMSFFVAVFLIRNNILLQRTANLFTRVVVQEDLTTSFMLLSVFYVCLPRLTSSAFCTNDNLFSKATEQSQLEAQSIDAVRQASIADLSAKGQYALQSVVEANSSMSSSFEDVISNLPKLEVDTKELDPNKWEELEPIESAFAQDGTTFLVEPVLGEGDVSTALLYQLAAPYEPEEDLLTFLDDFSDNELEILDSSCDISTGEKSEEIVEINFDDAFPFID